MKFKVKLSSALISMLVAGSVMAASTAKQVIYVDLDAQKDKAHAQMQLLKKMDVLGINFKKHRAEVYVTNEELAQLKAQKLTITKAPERTNELAKPKAGYMNPSKVVQQLTDIHTQYPTITKLIEVGRTTNNLPIMAIEISATPGDENKPVVLFNGMHHAREVMTPEVVMHIANVLTQENGKNDQVTAWLNHFRIVVLPQVNPDGNTIVSTGQDTMWRKNAFVYQNETVGVDLNRNYPAYWNYCGGSEGDPNSEIYRGPSAGSEPETKAMMALVDSLRPIADITYHSYSELIIIPYGCSTVDNPSKDLFLSVANLMNAGIRNDDNKPNAYQVGTAPELLYEVDGADTDYMWKEHGTLAYVIEVNADSFSPDFKKWRDVTIQRQEGGWEALLNRMMQSGFRATIQTPTPNDMRYSFKKIEGSRKVAFDTDKPNRTFALRSATGLVYQPVDKGQYEVTFYLHNQPVKTMTVDVGDSLVDLGNIAL